MAVVGAGFIGAEVAATARERGLEVTVIEALPVPLGRVLGTEIGTVCADVHRDHGVDLRLGVGVDGFGGHGRVERVNLSDGTSVDADVVVVGIGVVPNTEWLEGSGLTLDNGVVCDETCLAAPGIAAAGDVARWPNPLFGETMRVEHWDNAIAQGQHAALRLLQADDEAQPYAPVPWFWSDQYDRKIQLAGRAAPDDEVRIITGSTEERRFAALYGRAGRLVGRPGLQPSSPRDEVPQPHRAGHQLRRRDQDRRAGIAIRRQHRRSDQDRRAGRAVIGNEFPVRAGGGIAKRIRVVAWALPESSPSASW